MMQETAPLTATSLTGQCTSYEFSAAASTSDTCVKIQIVGAEGVERLSQPLGHIRLVCVPQFAGDEELLTRHSTVSDTLPHLVL